MVSSGWELFEHGADIGVRGFGETRDVAFEQTAVAMTAVITDPQKVAADVEVDISCEAPDDELLLVEWLNALVYEMATRHLLFARFEVHIENGALHAKAWGEQIDRARHEPAVEVKGATYTALKVRHDTSTWTAQCVVDV